VPVVSEPELQAETINPTENKPIAKFSRRITSPVWGILETSNSYHEICTMRQSPR
jgi:hypothetical protein